MLLVKDISLQRSNRKIFQDINVSLTSGKIIILKGKNGSGKTSLLKTILNILEPSNGSIFWKGKLLKKNLYDFYNNVTFISDRTSSIRQLTVYDNIKIWKKLFLSNVDYNQIQKILLMLNLDKYLKTKINTLSLGEMKKLELIRVIIQNKKIWILDEPFTNLDIESIKMIGQTFIDHCSKQGSIIFSSHQDPQIEVSEEILL